MAYIIEYEGQAYERFAPKKKRTYKPKQLIFLGFLIILTIVWTVTPVRVAVLDFILPGDGAVTRQAAGAMFQQMKDGRPFREAFSEFCTEILENA